ncbi:MAG: sulfatase-like hydrolase/transferase [Prevotella sp.]|nr:sulfatase-like hydrolase/transferase [Prevotella sp.]
MRKRLLYLVKVYVTTVLVFIIAKVVFMACNHEGQDFTIGDVINVILHGLSLDLSTALYLLIVPFLLTFICIWMNLPNGLFRGYYAMVSTILALAFVTDTSLYEFWQFKLDASCLQYLETPSEAMASVTKSYLLIRLFLVIVTAVAIYYIFTSISYKRLSESSYRNHTPKSFIYRKMGESVVYLLFIPIMVIGIRGGIGESTTNIGQVYFSENQFLNHSAVNPVFSFLYSANHQLGSLSQYDFFDSEKCERLVENVYTTHSILTDTLLNNTRPNIVIILMESAGEQFAEAMPHLQQLKEEGVYFNHCYANSWRTDRGTLATLSGYPSFPSVSVMKIPEKSRTLPSIASKLRQEGYATHYLYGGDINFTNMRSYLMATGWQHLISMDDFTTDEQHTAQWGVRDDITFNTLYQMIQEYKGKEPFLIGYSTLSSHEPWDVPTLTIKEDEVLNAFAYLDNCLYDFIGQLKLTPLWQNLLLVLIADHGILHKEVNQQKPLQKNHIPIIWLGGAVRQPFVAEAICNQSDLVATLFGQMNINHDEFTFSRDILSTDYVYPTAVNNYYNAQWIVDSTGYVLYDFDARRIIASEGEGNDTQRLLNVSKAILQATTNDLKNR